MTCSINVDVPRAAVWSARVPLVLLARYSHVREAPKTTTKTSIHIHHRFQNMQDNNKLQSINQFFQTQVQPIPCQ